MSTKAVKKPQPKSSALNVVRHFFPGEIVIPDIIRVRQYKAQNRRHNTLLSTGPDYGISKVEYVRMNTAVHLGAFDSV